MIDLEGKTALVTGASQGIGKAISNALLEHGASVIMVGRSESRLRRASQEFGPLAENTRRYEADLSNVEDIDELVRLIVADRGTLDILVNCGGTYSRGPWRGAETASLKSLFDNNVFGAYHLTKALLPALSEARGDVVFVNSSIVRAAGKDAGQFAACQHALKSLADSLRAEENAAGIRVLSVFPGQTATPRQAAIYAQRNQPYTPDRLLQPADIADAVVACLRLGQTAEVTYLHIRQRFPPSA